jgi:hypothetical protein
MSYGGTHAVYVKPLQCRPSLTRTWIRISWLAIPMVVATWASCSSAPDLTSDQVDGIKRCDDALFDATRACVRDGQAVVCPGRDGGLRSPRCPDPRCIETGRGEYRTCTEGIGPEVIEASRCVEVCTVNFENCLTAAGIRYFDCTSACPIDANLCETGCRSTTAGIVEDCLNSRKACPTACLDSDTGD